MLGLGLTTQAECAVRYHSRSSIGPAIGAALIILVDGGLVWLGTR